jgi:NAD+ diphosphatase
MSDMSGISSLNRLSWLRASPKFLNTTAKFPQARWLLFNAGQPLVDARKQLVYLPTASILPILGPEPFFGQGKLVGESLQADEETTQTESARHRGVPIVFLGFQEAEGVTKLAIPSQEFKDADNATENLDGIPYFSLDVSDMELSDGDRKGLEDGRIWAEPRSILNRLDPFDASVFAVARSMVDWNLRNKVRNPLLKSIPFGL